MDTYTRHKCSAFRDWIKSTATCGATPTLVSRVAFVGGYDRGYAQCRREMETFLEQLDIADAETTALERPADPDAGTKLVGRSDEG